MLANVYVPTATIARLMQSGELAGCVVSDDLVRRLETEKKPQRLERAALMVAAARDLGFAGAHIGGFGLTHKDFLTILERAAAIGNAWRGRMDELVFECPGEFYLLPPGDGGLSDGEGEYQGGEVQAASVTPAEALEARAPRQLIAPESPGARFFAPRIRLRLLVEAAGGVVPLSQGGVRLRELRRLHPGSPRLRGLLDALVLQGAAQRPVRRLAHRRHLRGAAGAALRLEPGRTRRTRAAGADPRRFARTLIPPRNWQLDETNALRNRFAETDNLRNRQEIHVHHR